MEAGVTVTAVWFSDDMAAALAGFVIALAGMVGAAVLDRPRREASRLTPARVPRRAARRAQPSAE